MEQDNCVICNVTIESSNKTDIQLTTTDHGNINIEEFIKESILGLHVKTELQSKYLCKLCYDDINQLEDYLMKSKHLQQSLVSKYLESNEGMKHEQEQPDFANNFTDESNSATQDLEETREDITPEKIKTETNSVTKRKSKRNVRSMRKPIIADDNFDSDDNEPKVRTRRKTASKKETAETKIVNSAESESHEPAPNEDTDVKVKKGNRNNRKQKKYCCEICGKVTARGNAAKHMNSHTHKKLFTCEFCNWQFTQNGDLQRHLRLHKGIFPYQCEYCPKRFAHHTSFDIHLKNHLGKRDHICVICGRGLLSQSHLARHMKTHTGEKEFACEICGKTCAEKSNLKKHMQIHLKQKTADA